MTNVSRRAGAGLRQQLGIAIIIFTLIMRLVTRPLTASQYKMSCAAHMQPKMGCRRSKGRAEAQAETMALYKDTASTRRLPADARQLPSGSPSTRRSACSRGARELVTLSQELYLFTSSNGVPLITYRSGIGQPDATLILPFIVAASMFVQQKMITPAPTASTAGSAAAQQAQMMTWMMPLIFGFWSLSVPAGLALYWAVTNVVGIITQYFFMGRKIDFRSLFVLNPAPQPAARNEPKPAPAPRAQPRQRCGTAAEGAAVEASRSRRPAPAFTKATWASREAVGPSKKPSRTRSKSWASRDR
jgi:YidC/Oxa1 family membrane protein insertase